MKGLEAVREAHLAAARAHAGELLAHAREVAQGILAGAQAEAAEVTRQAEQQGQASAEQDTGRDWTAARRRARAIRLAAERGAYEALRARAAHAVEADPRMGRLLRSIGDAARMRLGPGASVVLEPGAVVASRKTIHVRWTIEDAVDASLERLGPQLEELWL